MSNSLPGPRRIVTKHNDQGLATVASDTVIEWKEWRQGLRSHAIWATVDLLPTRDNSKLEDGASRRPDSSSAGSFGLVHPNGTNFIYTDFPPGYTGIMHRTLSLDYDILVSGQLVHITEDGIEKHLAVGDVVVQKGTMHAWKNPSTSSWARLATVLIAAEPAVVNETVLGPAYIPVEGTNS